MNYIKGQYIEKKYSKGKYVYLFTSDYDNPALEDIKGQELVLNIKKYHKPKTLDANNYFWALCTEIADVLKTDKDTVYLMMLKRRGVYTDLMVDERAIPILQQNFRYVEEFNDGYQRFGDETMVKVRCYYGSSKYDSKQMSEIIDEAVQECHSLGIPTMPPQEIERLLEAVNR